MPQFAGIYKITNPKNKNYIGQSINLEKRLYKYKHGDYKRQFLLSRSFEKYGYDNHAIEVLWKEEVTESTDLNELRSILNVLEIGYIKHFNSTDTSCGLNLDHGGGVFNLSILGKIRHSEGMCGEKNPMFGKIFSKETRDKMSKSRSGDNHWTHNLKGRVNPCKGQRRTEHTKKAISNSLKMHAYWIGKTGNLNPLSIKLAQLDMEGNLIKIWESINLAGKSLNISDGLIVHCCKTFKDGVCTNSYNSYLWVYLSDYNKYDKIIYKNKRCFSKPVLQFDLNLKLIREWDSALKIQKELGYNNAIIGVVCKRENKKYKGSLWIYKEEYYDNNETVTI